MSQLITLGETMVSFSPDHTGPLRYSNGFHMHIAGAESNVAVGVSKLGISAGWISRVGQDEFGFFIRNQLRSEGVDCQHLLLDSEHRTGIMFKEKTSTETKVTYYRSDSAASHLQAEDLSPAMFQGAKILHMTGITPVLSDSCLAATRQAFHLAKKHGLMISFDPNIRKKLWKGVDYAPVIQQLIKESDIVLLGLEEADQLYHTTDPVQISKILFTESATQFLAIKNGAKGAFVFDRKQMISLPPFPCHSIEPIGAGDGFNAGFLAGILKNQPLKTAGQMGCICGAMATETVSDTDGYPDVFQMEAALHPTKEIYR